MAFKPSSAFKPKNFIPRDPADFVQPEVEEGTQLMATSLIIDLGTQEREAYVKTDDKGNEIIKDGEKVWIHPKPAQQVAIYGDLLNETHDYGGDIGVKQVRLPLHGEFAGQINKPINFIEQPVRDADGNQIKCPWVIPGNNAIAKLAKASGCKVILEPGTFEEPNELKSDIEQILGKPFMIEVIVKKNTKDKNGEKVTYTNIYVKNPVPVMKGIPVPELQATPRCIGFESEVDEIVEAMQEVRAAVRRKIMQALNYDNLNYADENKEVVPSNMKIAFEQMGVNEHGFIGDPSQESEEEKPKTKAKSKKVKLPEPEDEAESDEDGDDPF